MRLKKFLKIKKYRIFDAFEWTSVGLSPFTQYNVIYGWNGTGKTTLAALFKKIQKHEDCDSGADVEIECDNALRINGANFNQGNLPSVRVFDRSFVEKSLEDISNGSATPVYYIGETTIEQAKQLKELKDKLGNLDGEIVKAQVEKSTVEKEFEKFKTGQARFVKDMMLGSPNYAGYNKVRFADGIEKARARGLTALTDDEKKKKMQQRLAKSKEGVSFPAFDVAEVEKLTVSVKAVLERSVVSNAIDELVRNPALASWVQTGLTLHEKSETDCKCLFCGGKLTKERRAQLENHFNDSYSRFQAEVTEVIGKAAHFKESVLAFKSAMPNKAQFYDDLADEYDAGKQNILSLLSRLDEYLVSLQGALEKKKANPFVRVQLDLTVENDGKDLIATLFTAMGEVKALVARHLEFTTTLETAKRRAENALVGDFLLSAIPTYDGYVKSVKDATTHEVSLLTERKGVQDKIESIERIITESRRPVKELNDELHSYLGRDELEFVLKDSGYTLLRNGNPAENLSEGERTAITFLYFLKMIKSKEFNPKQGIVVVDDPVSSLDANSLFAAFAYMRGALQDAGQLFVLTHNFSFFRNVKNWFKHVNKDAQDKGQAALASFYGLEALVKERKRSSRLVKLDPLLENYESEYHYLFEQVYACANCDETSGELKRYCPLPNVARRLLDAFLSFKYPDCRADNFAAKIRCVPELDVGNRQRLLRFLNTYSHVDGMPTPEFDVTLLAESKSVMQLILRVIEMVDKVHFDRMVSLIKKIASK